MVATRSSTRSASSSANNNNNNNSTTPTDTTTTTTKRKPLTTRPVNNVPEIDPTSKARTITHMNKDHSEDMSAILRHYSGLTEAQAAGAEMLDLDLVHMTIRAASSGIHSVAVVPPMADWSDRRTRLVDMTVEARTALGLTVEVHEEEEKDEKKQKQKHVSDRDNDNNNNNVGVSGAGQVIKWYPPEGADLIPFLAVLLEYISALLIYTGQVVPGSPLWRGIEALPTASLVGPAGWIWAVKTALPMFVGVHLVEMVIMDRTRLVPAGVKRGSLVWFLWLGCQFVDGFATFQRWNRRVVRKGAKSQ